MNSGHRAVAALIVTFAPMIGHGAGGTPVEQMAPVPCTGQMLCHDEFGEPTSCGTGIGTGQDADKRAGVTWPTPRFNDNPDGTVTDRLTGLVWLKDTSCLGDHEWTTALSLVNNLESEQCSLSDGSRKGEWRLPNMRELESLLDYGQTVPPLLPAGHPFSNVQDTYYWSSTTQLGATWNAWKVRFSNGSLSVNSKIGNFYAVWAVRDELASFPGRSR